MPRKYALIIGINRYLYMEEKYQLEGCVNDAKLIGSILVDKFNFDKDNIVYLLDENASRDRILAQMDILAETISEGDILVFHYSGHGHRCKVKTQYTDEGSGKENCILPTDDAEPGADGDIYREIRDQQINNWLQRIAKVTPYTTLIFDACHSGTITRGSSPSCTVRNIPASARNQPPAVAQKRAAEKTIDKTAANSGGWLNLNDNFVVISGCLDTQTSKETWFSQGDVQTKHGVLTRNLANALQQAQPGSTYRDIFELTCAGVLAQANAQNPQIEGKVDREIFGVQDIEPLRYLPVTAVEGCKITLGGGVAHGVRCGSKWAIYPPGTKQESEKNLLGELLITSVEALSAHGTVNSNSTSLISGARCVELERPRLIEPLLVDVSRLSERNQKTLTPCINQSPLLALANSAREASVLASVIDSAEELPESVSQRVRDAIATPSWAFFDDSNELCMPVHSESEPNVITVLGNNLEKMAQFRNVMLLANPGSTLDVEFNLYRRTQSDELTLANGGSCEFSEGDGLVLEVINRESTRPVFFSILWLSADKGISSFYPHRKSSEELSPGKTVRIGGGKRRLGASLGIDYFSDLGNETCKVIFSTKQSDFTWLNQGSLRSSSLSALSAFDEAYTGRTTAEEEKQTATSADWTAVNRSFLLSRSGSPE